MSVKLIGLVLETDLPSSEKLLLLVLADAASEEGVCWPRQSVLAARSSLSDRSVRRILDDLRELGLVDWEQRGLTRSNLYRIDVDGLSALAGAVTMSDPDTPDRTSVSGQERSSASGQERSPASGHRNRKSEPSREPSTKDGRDLIFEAVARVCGIDWTAPLTATARGQINKAVRELREIGASPEDVARVAAAYRIRWPEIDLTPTALVKHWGTATAPLPASPEAASTARRRLAPPPGADSSRILPSGESEGSSST